MHGYVPLDDCKPAQSRKEAIESELYIAGSDNVDYNADYDVKAYSEDGSQKLYQGPGTKYGEVPGVRDIQNGETLHITEDAELVDGSHWGVTTIDDQEGWVDLEKTEEWAKAHGTYEDSADTQALEMTPVPGTSDTVDAVPETTVAPSVTEGPQTTVIPSVTPTETPEATVTPEPTDTPAPTETPEPTETQAPTDTPDPKTTEQAEKDNVQTSGKTVTASESSKSQNPLIWIAGIAVLAAIGVIIYHYKKR